MSGVRVSQPVLSIQSQFIFKKMAGLISYVKDSFEELRNHVTWTPWTEAQRLTVMVAVFSILFSLAIWGVDTVFSRVVEIYFDLLS